MVAGPQVGYFNPQILMEQDVHAPAGRRRPGIDAQGASFVGINLYVQLGRGRDYAWSATSAGQDIIDTFALDALRAGGGKPTISRRTTASAASACRSRCSRRPTAGAPTPGDQTPPGTQTLRAERTKLGLVAGRGTVRGKPVIFTKLRSTYFHEVDSRRRLHGLQHARGRPRPGDLPARRGQDRLHVQLVLRRPRAHRVLQLGRQPGARASASTTTSRCARGATSGGAGTRTRGTARFAAFARTRRRSTSATSSTGTTSRRAASAASDENVCTRRPTARVLLEDRAQARRSRGGAQAHAAEGRSTSWRWRARATCARTRCCRCALQGARPAARPALRDAVDKLRAWRRAGGQRRDGDRDGVYEHADAIRIMDAWWPRWVRAQFQPALGQAAVRPAARDDRRLDNAPNNHGDHLGSAYQDAWYGYVRKDLRTCSGARSAGRYSRATAAAGRSSAAATRAARVAARPR